MTDVWGFGRDDVYAVSGNDLLHYDGAAWRTAETAGVDVTSRNLWAVWGSDEGAFAVGDLGTILRHDASAAAR